MRTEDSSLLHRIKSCISVLKQLKFALMGPKNRPPNFIPIFQTFTGNSPLALMCHCVSVSWTMTSKATTTKSLYRIVFETSSPDQNNLLGRNPRILVDMTLFLCRVFEILCFQTRTCGGVTLQRCNILSLGPARFYQ